MFEKQSDGSYLSLYSRDSFKIVSGKYILTKQNETIKNYDKAGRLIEVEGEVEYIYNIDGTLQKLIYENGAIEEYIYNADKTLQKVINTYNEIIEEYSYNYDKNKNIIKKIDLKGEILYTYDVLNRLKTVTDTELTTYLYDRVGNRTKETTGLITKDYVYDAKNELTKITEKNNNVQTRVVTYTYDNNGNQLQEIVDNVVKQINTYNYKNELMKTVINNEETNYTYNAEGKRIKKATTEKTIKYVYEGLNIILELDNNNNEIANNKYGLNLISREIEEKLYKWKISMTK